MNILKNIINFCFFLLLSLFSFFIDNSEDDGEEEDGKQEFNNTQKNKSHRERQRERARETVNILGIDFV